MRPTTPGEAVCLEAIDQTLVITVNRPDKRNAVNRAVAEGIAHGLDRLDDDRDLRVGVITGSGGTFSAGMDLVAFSAGEACRTEDRGFAGIVERPPVKPLIAAVDGWALGGGFEIVLACDLVVASTRAAFGLPEVKRGLVARGGGAFRLPRRLPRAIALEFLLTGGSMDAEQAATWGLVNRVCDPDHTVAAALTLAGEISVNAPLAVYASKRMALQSADWPNAEAFDRQKELIDPVFASADAQEGAAAFKERRPANWSCR